jgi:flagellar motor switch protein FliM
MDQSIFTTAEIDLLLKSAKSRQPGGAAPAPAPNADPFDFHGVSDLSGDQIAKLLELHVDFGNRLGRSLSTLLGCECKAVPTSAEQMVYGDLAKQFPESEFFGTIHTQAPEESVFLQADLASVLPMIDLTIGGIGGATETIRHLTDIERELFKPVVDMFGNDLQEAWAPVMEAVFRLDYCGGAANFLPAGERVLFVKFDIEIGELHGVWTLILPMLVTNALTRKLEEQLSRAASERSELNQQRLRERLLDSRFRLELFLPPSGISVRKLAHLKPGQVLVLKPRSSDPIHFNIEGINLFHASPVSCGMRRGAQIKRMLSTVKGKGKEAR